MPDLQEIFNRREDLPDGGHYDIIDQPEVSTEEKAVDVMIDNTEVSEPNDDVSSVSKMFSRMLEIQKGPQTTDQSQDEPALKTKSDWIWAELPDDIRDRLATWRDMFVKAIPGAEPVKNLHITLFHEILNIPRDLNTIIATTSNVTPAEATLGSLKAFRTESHGVAVVIDVKSPQLRDLRHALEFIEHTPSIHIYSPHITLAYIPECEGTAIEGLELFGIRGQEFVIDSICVGTQDSNHPCAMLGANAEWISRFEPTRKTEKSFGMSTLTAEDGGILTRPDFDTPYFPGDDDDQQDKSLPDNDDDDDDSDDEQWIRRSQEMADNLDDMFGAF